MQNASNRSFHIREMKLEDIPAVYALGEAVFTADKWPSLYRTWDEYEPVGLFYSDGEFCFVADCRSCSIRARSVASAVERRSQPVATSGSPERAESPLGRAARVLPGSSDPSYPGSPGSLRWRLWH